MPVDDEGRNDSMPLARNNMSPQSVPFLQAVKSQVEAHLKAGRALLGIG